MEDKRTTPHQELRTCTWSKSSKNKDNKLQKIMDSKKRTSHGVKNRNGLISKWR